MGHQMMLRFALGATMLAAACGEGGENNGSLDPLFDGGDLTLVEAMTGRWNEVEPGPSAEYPDAPIWFVLDPTGVRQTPLDCGYPDQTPGDACLGGFRPVSMVLDGTRLYLDAFQGALTNEGEVLNHGTRVEYTYTYTDACPSEWEPSLTEGDYRWGACTRSFASGQRFVYEKE